MNSNLSEQNNTSEKSIHLFNLNNRNSFNNNSNYQNNMKYSEDKKILTNNNRDNYKLSNNNLQSNNYNNYFNDDEQFVEQTFQKELLEDIDKFNYNTRKKETNVEKIKYQFDNISLENKLIDIWDTKIGFYNEGLSCYV